MRREFSLVVCLILLSLVMTTAEGVDTSRQMKIEPPHGKFIPSQYTYSGPRIISGDAELATFASVGSGTEGDPYIIRNIIIESSEYCLQIRDTTAHFIIYDCIFTAVGLSPDIVTFNNVENGAIIDCRVFGAANGIEFIVSANCSVENCHIYGNSANGIYLYQSDNCQLEENLLYGNNKGIMFEGSTLCSISNNSIYRNTFAGIEFEPYSHNNTVYNNSIGWNSLSGFGDVQVNVRNNAPDNRFHDGIGTGNRWADYNESRVYSVSGDYRENDTYASLFEDLLVPHVSSPMDTAIDIEVNGNYLVWEASDDTPYQYTVFLNDITHYSEIWDGEDVRLLLDSLHRGTYNITLTIMDAGGNVKSDSVFVTAVSFVFGGMGTVLVMLASGVTVVVFLLLLALAKKIA